MNSTQREEIAELSGIFTANTAEEIITFFSISGEAEGQSYCGAL